MRAFCVSTSHKIAIVRNYVSAVIQTACNITYTVEKPIAALFDSSENFFFRCFYMKEQLLFNLWISDYKFCILYFVPSLYPFLPKTVFPTAQSPLTKSNGGTVTAHHVSFAREKSLTSFTPGKLCI